jgi:hypothetical protein
MAVLDVTKKLHIYHTLYRLNLSFASIVTRCRALEESGIFPAKTVRRYQGFTQELQSEINEELLETMQEIESDDWNRHGKVRQAWEKELRDPDDVLASKERGGERAKRGKKARSQGIF